MKRQNNFVLWLTGLSAAGKTTLARSIKEELTVRGLKAHHLDGDEVRAAQTKKLGFSKEDRDENIRQAIELCGNYQQQGFIVIASFISPYRQHRVWGREKLENYIEVFVNCSIRECEKRDPKGLYQQARSGRIKGFTGLDDPYEEPLNPELEIKTDLLSVGQCLDRIISYLAAKQYLPS